MIGKIITITHIQQSEEYIGLVECKQALDGLKALQTLGYEIPNADRIAFEISEKRKELFHQAREKTQVKYIID